VTRAALMAEHAELLAESQSAIRGGQGYAQRAPIREKWLDWKARWEAMLEREQALAKRAAAVARAAVAGVEAGVSVVRLGDADDEGEGSIDV
jgi:hypothetical protein